MKISMFRLNHTKLLKKSNNILVEFLIYSYGITYPKSWRVNTKTSQVHSEIVAESIARMRLETLNLIAVVWAKHHWYDFFFKSYN